MLNYREIQERNNVLDVARSLGLDFHSAGSSEYRGLSVFAPNVNKTCTSIDTLKNVWYDHKECRGGKALELVAVVKYGSIDRIQEAAKYLVGDDGDYDSDYWSKLTAQRDKFRADVQTWHKALLENPRALDYLHSRKITDETIERFTLGLVNEWLTVNGSLVQEWRLAVPYKDGNGNPVYMVSRRLDWSAHEGSPKYHKLKQNEFLRNAPFGMNTIPAKNDDCDILTIGEGFVDGLTLAQEGYKTLFSGGGYFGHENEADVIKEARRFRKIITCFDSDEAGQNFTMHWARLFLDARINFRVVADYGTGCKDVSDYYTAGGFIPALLDRAVNGFVFMARKLRGHYPFRELSIDEKEKRLAEVKSIIYKLKGFLDVQEMAEVIEAFAEYYPKDKIAKFSEGPTSDEVISSLCDKFMEGRHIFFHGSIEHGEYFQYSNAGYWCRMTNAELHADIHAFFEGRENPKTVSKIATLVRLRDTRAVLPEWNKGRLDNFPNGTLELDTGKFREHRPEDYLTHQHIFDYTPRATEAPTYDAFMPAITKGKQSRIDHLTDMLAYCLYEDNRLEKLFFLIGNGANGKGTFLHLVEDLFRNANPCKAFNSATHVQPKDMDRPTERIALEGSILNIAFDIDPDLRGCSSYLKSLAGNDILTGNTKFHDSHSFTSRAKVISSCNHIPRIDDDSYGMRRKLCFVRFEAKFDSGRADTSMREKLQEELPAIYNRVYRAYLELLKREAVCGQDAIRLSCDQPELIDAFTVFADPIRDFWRTVKEDYLSRGEIKKPEVYEDFKNFAERNNIDLIRAGIREKTFQTKFFAVLNEDSAVSANYSQRKTKEGRYYCYTIQQRPEALAYEPEADCTAPVPDESTQPEVTQTTPDDDTPAVIEAMTEENDSKQQEEYEPPAPFEHVPTPEEDAQTLERLFSGEKVECD